MTPKVAQDNARLAIVSGLCVPATLSFLVLVVTRLAMPAEHLASSDDPMLHTFFGLACVPFSLGALVTLLTHPIEARAKRLAAWAALALALLGALYAFGGWRLMPSRPEANTSSAPKPPVSVTSRRA